MLKLFTPINLVLVLLMLLLAWAVPQTMLAALTLFFALSATGLYLKHRERIVYAMAQFDDEPLTRQLEGLGFICKTVSVNIASMAAGASGVGTVAVVGLTPNHRCIVQTQAALSVAIAVNGARCAAAGTLTVDATNPSAGTLDAAALNCTLWAIPGDLN